MAKEINQPFTVPSIPIAVKTPRSFIRVLTDLYERHSSSDGFWIGVITVACLVVMLPLFLFGIPHGYDLGQHLRLAQAFAEGASVGNFEPSWGALDNYGFGSIAVRIYPPIFDYLWGLVSIVTGEYYASVLITVGFLMLPGSIGIYFWAREYVDQKRAALAAVIYMIVPYHLMQVYQSGLFSEFAAAAVLPFCFLFATRAIEKASPTNVVLLAVSYATLILTHIPSIIIGSLALSVYCLSLIDWKQPAGPIVRLGTSVLLAAAASSFYWLRVVTEFSWVKVTEAENFSGHYNYRQYLFPMIFSSSEEFYWSRLLWLGDIVIVLTFLLVIPAVIAIFAVKMEPRFKRLFLSLLITSGFVLFILSSASSLIWEHAPLLHRIQFSWRFLVAGSVVATLSFALAVPLLWNRFPTSHRVMGYALIIFAGVLFIVNIGEIVLPSAALSRESFNKTYEDLNESEGCNCFWPSWANANAFSNRELVSAQGRAVEVLNWGAESRQFVVSGGAEGTARVATLWYPYWSATIDGSPAEVRPDADGAILLSLPADTAKIDLVFTEPAFLVYAKYASLAVWLTLIASLLFLRSRSR